MRKLRCTGVQHRASAGRGYARNAFEAPHVDVVVVAPVVFMSCFRSALASGVSVCVANICVHAYTFIYRIFMCLRRLAFSAQAQIQFIRVKFNVNELAVELRVCLVV